MTDYLLVHGAGQGAWSWGQVWGYLTAPVVHPPRLYVPRLANRVYPLDLPGHGADAGGDTSEVRLEECVHAIIRTVEREDLKNLVLVGHGFAASLVLQAAGQLPQPPKRIILVAGMVPLYQRTMVSVLPQAARMWFRFLSALSKLSGRELKLPRSVINNFLCNGMDPMEIVHVVGRFGAMPTRVLTTRVSLDQTEHSGPVTYVVLTQDKMLPPDLQRRMAQRLTGVEVEITQVESCHQVTLYKPRELADILLSYA